MLPPPDIIQIRTVHFYIKAKDECGRTLAAKLDARTCTALFSSVFRYGGSFHFSAVDLESSLNSEWISTDLPSRRRERYAYAAALCPTAVFRERI